jgi:hypothetical protein
MSERNKNTQRGIKIDATFGQLMSALFIFFMLFVLPIGGYEFFSARYGSNGSNGKDAYTVSALEKNNKQQTQSQTTGSTNLSDSEGKVAGISTVKAADKVNSAKDAVTFFTSSQTLMLVSGLVLIAISLSLGGSLVYDFMKK